MMRLKSSLCHSNGLSSACDLLRCYYKKKEKKGRQGREKQWYASK